MFSVKIFEYPPFITLNIDSKENFEISKKKAGLYQSPAF